MDPWMPRMIQDQWEPKSLHQKISGDIANNTRGQHQANCTSCHRVQGLPRRSSVPTAVLHEPEPLYQLWNGANTSHLLFMDVIKLNKTSTLWDCTQSGRKEAQELVSVRTTVQDETVNICEYIKKMADRMLSEYFRWDKPEKEEKGLNRSR